ncbi:MAG: esterase/lipase family protein [Candidatus Kariarchaeaceae archaeon]|jgi:triacylglycerol lipase
MKIERTLQPLILMVLCVGWLYNPSILSADTSHQADQEINPVLFLHGWTATHEAWDDMIEYFLVDGWPSDLLYAYDFDNTDNCSVQANIDNANRIKQWVEEILDTTGAEKIDLVGHSMGGLNSRYYIKFLGGIDQVDDHVSIATGHHSVYELPDLTYPCKKEWIDELVVLLNEGDETPGGILNDTSGIRQDPISEERKYNSSHVSGTINYTSIYAKTFDGQIPSESCVLDGAYNVIWDELFSPNLGHVQILDMESTYNLILPAIDGPFSFDITNDSSGFELPLLLSTLGIIMIYRRKR